MRILIAFLLLFGARCFAASPVFLGATTDYITNSGGTITFVYLNRAVVIATRGSGAVSYLGSLNAQSFTGSALAPFTVKNTNGATFAQVSTGGVLSASSDALATNRMAASLVGSALTEVFGSASTALGRTITDRYFTEGANIGLGIFGMAAGASYLMAWTSVTPGLGSDAGNVTQADAVLGRVGIGSNHLANASLAPGTGSLLASNLVANGVVALKATFITNTPPAAHAMFFAATNTGVVEMMVIDSGGNVTQLSAHPLDAPPVFYITTNWVGGVPNISKTLKMYAGVIEWQNQSLASLIDKWRTDNELFGSNYFTQLVARDRTAIRTARHQVETFAAYNARMGFTNGDPRALARWNWASIQTQRQAAYDAARAAELAAIAAGATNVTVRPVANVREPKPELIDWDAP